jgi:molecular chaperone HtpG
MAADGCLLTTILDRGEWVSNKQQGKLTINLPNLIRTLGEYLYSDPNVALRELIQNAHDTCVAAESLAPGGPRPEIHVGADPFDRVLVVKDNGAGMTKAEVEKFLTVIGNSRTDEVRKQLEELGRHDIADRLIGRFGIGLLSAFIVAARVEFKTRSRQLGSKVVTWQCDGGSEYQIAETDDKDTAIGTEVTLYIEPRYVGMLAKKELERLIRRYADLLRIPVYLDPNPNPINAMDAPWDHSASVAEYERFLQDRYPTDEFLDIIPIDEDDGTVKVRGALFVPKQQWLIIREHGDLTIYCHRYFVCDDHKTLLPPWARFVRGVIDSPSLREMASREAVLKDENFERVQALLGKALLTYLRERHAHNPTLFRQLVTGHSTVIKAWALASDELFDCVKDMVLFDTDVGKLTIPEYLSRSQYGHTGGPGVNRIFYFVTPGGPGQHAVLFKAKGLHVIDASGFPNRGFLEKYAASSEAVELHRLDLDARGFIFEAMQHKSRKWRELEGAYADLSINAEVVTFVPEEITGVLLQEEAEGVDLAEVRDLLADSSMSATIKSLLQQTLNKASSSRNASHGTTLYLNANNGIIQKLSEIDLRDPEAMEIARAIYHNALLLSLQGAKLALTPADAKTIFDGMNRTLAALMAKIFEINKLQSESLVLRASVTATVKERQARHGKSGSEVRHVVCFFAVPFSGEYDVIHTALRQVLEDAPYFWEVARADRTVFERTVPDNVASWIERAQCYAVDISDCNPNVMMELGQIYWGFPQRPLMLLEREGINKSIIDLGATIRIDYPWSDRPNADEIAQVLRRKIGSVAEVQKIRGERHFLSPFCMRGIRGIDPAATTALAEKFSTIEEFLERDPVEVARHLSDYLPHKQLVSIIQDALRSKLEQSARNQA